MKATFGWLILIAVIGGLFAATGMTKGWTVAVIAWGSAVVLTSLIALAAYWIGE